MSKKAEHDSVSLQLIRFLKFLNCLCNFSLLLVRHSQRNACKKEIRILLECLFELSDRALKLPRVNMVPSQVLVDTIVERIQLEGDLALNERFFDAAQRHQEM